MYKHIFFSLFILCFLETVRAAHPKSIMLVLGSDKSDILQTRIQLAYKLYKVQSIDKIIVSGGCGAHASSICEATMMYDGLVKLGIESSKIYKEENSKSTVQNYVFSRVLKDEFNKNIINPGDTVFVVSDHWHAISVASRLKKYDKVHAKFFIEGDITPKAEDKLDYVSILNGEIDNNVFVRKAIWLTPQISWKDKNSTRFLMDSILYEVDEKENKILSIDHRKYFFKELGKEFAREDWSFIDSRTSWFVKIVNTIYEIDKASYRILKSFSWKEWIKDMPQNWWITGFNAGVIIDNRLILFANNTVMIANRKNKSFVFDKQGVASDMIEDWPFSWGKSNVAGVSLDEESKSIILYRNREYLRMNQSLKVTQQPIKLNVKWVNNQ